MRGEAVFLLWGGLWLYLLCAIFFSKRVEMAQNSKIYTQSFCFLCGCLVMSYENYQGCFF